MDILHVGSSDIGIIGKSGVSVAVLGYATSQAAAGHKVRIASTANLTDIDNININNFKYNGWMGKKVQFSYDLFKYINKEANVNIIHNHGLWRFPNIISSKGLGNAKIISSPHGSFSDWAINNKKFEKQFMLHFLGQRRMLKAVDLFHATSLEELEQIRKQKLLQPVMVVENGVDIPNINQYCKNPSLRTMLFIGRIHPIKGLSFLLDSWYRIAVKYSDWQLIIAGPVSDLDHEKDLQAFISNKNLKNVRIIGAVTGRQKEKLLAESDCLVLTSYSENFAIVVAEALAHGTAALVTEGSPWSILNTENCGWYVPRNVEEFDSTLSKILNTPREDIIDMGFNGHKLASNQFSWDKVAQKLILGYEWALGISYLPDFIHIDE